MKMKHTPGPWTDHGQEIVGNDRHIARAYNWGLNSDGDAKRGEENRKLREEGEANARIIAAAPELLAVVERLNAELGRAAANITAPRISVLRDIHSAALAAIAKAIG